MLKTKEAVMDDHNSCSKTEGQFTTIGNTDLASAAGWRLRMAALTEKKLVTVVNKFNPDLFAYNGAAVWYNSPNQSRNTC